MSDILLKYANDNIQLTHNERENVITKAAEAYALFLDALQIDWKNDPNSSNTPLRVAKSYVNDLITGCYAPPPDVTAFDNLQNYDGIVCQTNIEVNSICSHHHLPFIGKAHVAYIPGKKVVGLSKLNRIVEWFSRRPQVQENLTMQIHDFVNTICEGNGGVAVMIECSHLCACLRGVKHDSVMKTAKLSGAFMEQMVVRDEFYNFVK